MCICYVFHIYLTFSVVQISLKYIIWAHNLWKCHRLHLYSYVIDTYVYSSVCKTGCISKSWSEVICEEWKQWFNQSKLHGNIQKTCTLVIIFVLWPIMCPSELYFLPILGDISGLSYLVIGDRINRPKTVFSPQNTSIKISDTKIRI